MSRFNPVIILLFIITLAAHASIINIPEDYESIQDAIDEAGGGDTLIIADGEYYERIDFSGKSLLITSELLLDGDRDHISATIIDGSEEGTVVQFVSGERSSTLSGLTLRNGSSDNPGGGGILCDGSQPVLEHLIIENCYGARGGGILCDDSDTFINDVYLHGNIADNHGGGISIVSRSNTTISNCIITDNRAGVAGGGISSLSGQGTPSIRDSEVSGNQSEGNGGGIYIHGDADVENVLIEENIAGEMGGGLFLEGDAQLEWLIVRLNHATAEGGGIAIVGTASPLIYRTEITLNTAEGDGGGLYVEGDDASPDLNFTTLSYNQSELDGGGVFGYDGANVDVWNSIVVANVPQAFYFSVDGEANSLFVEYSNIEGGQDSLVLNENTNLRWDDTNIDVDPLFSDPDERDFRITWDNFPTEDESKSPCIDAGSPEDEDDPDRTQADMGVYYFHQAKPMMRVEPDFHQFGVVSIQDTASVVFTITNRGEVPLIISDQTFSEENNAYIFLAGAGEVTLDSGEVHETTVGFSPFERGESNITYTIFSNDGELPEFEIRIFGTGDNQLPFVETPIPDVEVEEDPGQMVIIDSLMSVFSDLDGDELGFEVVASPAILNMRVVVGHRLEMQPRLNFNNTDGLEVVIGANDHNGGTVTDTFIVTILPVNDQPDSFDLSSPEDNYITDAFDQIFEWERAVDVDGDELHYTLHLHPDNAAVDTTLTFDAGINNSITIEEFDVILSELGYWGEMSVFWWVVANDDELERRSSGRWELTFPDLDAGRANLPVVPTDYSFAPIAPNPFNGSALLSYALPAGGVTRITVYNGIGKLVDDLSPGFLSAGYYSLTWDASRLPTGIYLISLQSGSFRTVRKAFLIR